MLNIKKSKILFWTNHAKDKMNFYKLSESRVKRVINYPYRIEEGIAPKTIAMMQPASLKMSGKIKKWSQEIWVMIQESAGKRKIISAWRYPAMTKPGDPLPKEILNEVLKELRGDIFSGNT